MLVCLRCCEQSQWRPRKAILIICVHITDLSPKWYICLHGVLEVRWSSLMKRSWETPWSWTLTGWPRQTWNILFWNSMKMYQGLWRIMKERGYHVHLFRGLVSLSAGCCQHLQLPPGSSRKCGTSKADGTAEEANSILSVSCQCLATWELAQWDQYNSQKSCGLLANSQPWTGVFWNVASCMWTCWSNTSGNHPGLLSTFQRWSTFCCGLTCSFPPRKRTEWFARFLRVGTDQSTNLQVCRDSDKVDGRWTWHELPV